MKKFLAILISFLICGCVKSPDLPPKRTQILIKSPIIKINDVAFIKLEKTTANLQILNSGVSVLNLKLGNKICINNACYKREIFNEKFFGKPYYPKLLDQILRGEPIFGGADLTRIADGFEQNLSKNFIKYKSNIGLITFKNNNTKIILRDLNEINRSAH